MLYRQLGRTGLRVSEIGLGCASFWGKKVFDEAEAVRLVHAAADNGVTFFDTGSSYSGGNAEPRLGRALATRTNRHDLVVATKAGTCIGNFGRLYKDFSPAAIRQSVERSLTRLQLDAIPLLQLHGPQIAQLTDNLLSELERLRGAGKIRHLSVNSFDMPVVRHVMTLPTFGAVMIDYNILRQERAPIIEELAARQFGILAGMALAGGLFIRARKPRYGLRDLWYAARILKNHRADWLRARRFGFLNDQAGQGWSAEEIALAWVLRNPHVSSAVFGTTRMANLLNNLKASGRTMDPALFARVEAAAAV